jgi:hypothetical protein
MKIPRWAQVLIGVGIIAVFLGIGAIIAITAWVSQNLKVSDEISQRDADAEFEKVRQQFSSRPALLELKDGVPHYVEARKNMPAERHALETLHVLAWDADDEKLARISIPWWVLRLKSEPIRFSSYASGFDDGGVTLRPEDIEKYGPGIILEGTGRRGERVLLWAQ